MAAPAGIYHPPVVPIFSGIYSGQVDENTSLTSVSFRGEEDDLYESKVLFTEGFHDGELVVYDNVWRVCHCESLIPLSSLSV